jgi:hypothetical protein
MPVAAAPPAQEWAFWHEANPASTARVEHTVWDGLLARYVVPGSDGINRFRYATATPGDRQALAADLDRLAGVPVRALNRAEQMAYWINLYNELTVKVVLDHYPVKSIRDIAISPGLFATGPWGHLDGGRSGSSSAVQVTHPYRKSLGAALSPLKPWLLSQDTIRLVAFSDRPP